MRRTFIVLVLAVSMWNASALLPPLWSSFAVLFAGEGLGWDPNGQRLAAPLPQPTQDAGFGLDPSGNQ